jgi:hypothetical protein
MMRFVHLIVLVAVVAPPLWGQVAHGNAAEVEQAHAILATTAPERLDVHGPTGADHDAH